MYRNMAKICSYYSSSVDIGNHRHTNVLHSILLKYKCDLKKNLCLPPPIQKPSLRP